MTFCNNAYGTLSIDDFPGKDFPCECGKTHSVDIKKIVIEKGVLRRIPEILTGFGIKGVLLASDGNTYKAAGETVENILIAAGISYDSLIYRREGDLVPDEKAIEEMASKVAAGTDAILAVGSGVLNDISKYVGYKQNIPSIIVATAPSMDGYASDTSALILENLKTSCPVRMPIAIIADTQILKEAPMNMILAGLGDMIGKFNALKDWKLGHLVMDEYYCPGIAKMVESALKNCILGIGLYRERDELAVKRLMEGLVLTGIAMSFAGNSRPASGAEHHMSHFWEMMFLLRGKPAVLHGTKVGITTLAAAEISRRLCEGDIDISSQGEFAPAFDEDKWASEIKRIYEKAADGVLNLSRKGDRNSLMEKEKRRTFIKTHWDKIISILGEGPGVEELEGMLRRAGAPVNPRQIGVDETTVYEGAIYAKDIRPRYTVLQLLWDIDMLETFAGHIRDYYFKEK